MPPSRSSLPALRLAFTFLFVLAALIFLAPSSASAQVQPGSFDILVQSADMSGNVFEGMWVELFQNGQLIDSGFTPFSTTVDAGVQYEVLANNWQDIIFDHWEDGTTNPTRSFVITQDSQFTAFYQKGS